MEFDATQRAVANAMAREDLYFYTRWMYLQRTGRKWLKAPHHEVIANALTRVYNGECKRLIINMPPRYGKTEQVMNFVSWSLGQQPDSEFIYTSYSSDLAENNSWLTREMVSHPGYAEIFPEFRLNQDRNSRNDWRTDTGGVVYAAGAGGTITGYGGGKKREGFGGAIIVDDAHKADEATSDAKRTGVIKWFKTTIESRVNSAHTPIIIIMQRLHEEDLAGWLLSGGTGEEWEHICLPALREDGTALWPEMHSIERLQMMQRSKPYEFSGQYQQRPSPAQGGFFKPHVMPVVNAIPFGTRFCRGWDLAASTGNESAWTCGLKLGLMPDKRWIIADVKRFRGTPDQVEAGIVNTAAADGKSCSISIPQDPGQAGKAQVAYLTAQLAGYTVKSSPESGDKVTRAEPAASQVNVGNIWMLQAPWNDELTGEMTMFPNSKFKDQVDALSRSFTELSSQGEWVLSTLPRSN